MQLLEQCHSRLIDRWLHYVSAVEQWANNSCTPAALDTVFVVVLFFSPYGLHVRAGTCSGKTRISPLLLGTHVKQSFCSGNIGWKMTMTWQMSTTTTTNVYYYHYYSPKRFQMCLMFFAHKRGTHRIIILHTLWWLAALCTGRRVMMVGASPTAQVHSLCGNDN